MSKKTFFTALMCGLIAISVQPLLAAPPSLAGSWQFTLIPGASPATTPAVEIPGLATFTADGSAIETDGSEFAAVPSSTATPVKSSTPGHGIWQMANTPETLYVQYISLVLEPDGSLFARNITTMFLTVDPMTGSTFKGTYTTVQIMGTIAKVVSEGKVTGTLIPHVPLP